MDISRPTHPPGHPGRDDELESIVEAAVDGMWEFVEEAGWTEDEFNRVLLEVAMRHAPDAGKA